MVSKPRNYNMVMAGKRLGKTLPIFKKERTGIILQRDDPWSWYMDKGKLTRDRPNYLMISHPGVHDDIWIHPKDYVVILQCLYETKLLADPKQG